MARGSGMLNNKHPVFFDAINSEATEDCLDGIQAAQVRRLLHELQGLAMCKRPCCVHALARSSGGRCCGLQQHRSSTAAARIW